jgi:hypothetical protein
MSIRMTAIVLRDGPTGRLPALAPGSREVLVPEVLPREGPGDPLLAVLLAATSYGQGARGWLGLLVDVYG